MIKLFGFAAQLTTAQKIGYGFVIFCLFVVMFEISGLLYLRSQVGRYETYWNNEAQKTGELLYVALGDSAAQGIGATSPRRGYVGLVAKRLEQQTGKTVRVVNLSKTGAKIDDVIDRQLGELSKYPEADLVTIEIGANDVKSFEPEIFREQFGKVVEAMPSGSFISDLPDFGGGPLLKPEQEASIIAREIINAREDVVLVKLEKEIQDRFRHWIDHSFDFFHPDNNGYKIWADAFWQAIEPAIEEFDK